MNILTLFLQCVLAYCSPPTPLFSNGNAKKPFCRRLVNHFMDVLKQKIIGLSCTDLVLVPILQGAIPYTYSKAEIQWLTMGSNYFLNKHVKSKYSWEQEQISFSNMCL